MSYFVLYDADQNIIGFLASDRSPTSPYYEEVSAEDFVSLGGIIPEPITKTEDPVDLLKSQLQAQSDRSDFLEDCIAEMAAQLYGV